MKQLENLTISSVGKSSKEEEHSFIHSEDMKGYEMELLGIVLCIY